MAEIDPELLKTVVSPPGILLDHVQCGHIIVGSRDGCLQDAGELFKAGIGSTNMLEISQILREGGMVRHLITRTCLSRDS